MTRKKKIRTDADLQELIRRDAAGAVGRLATLNGFWDGLEDFRATLPVDGELDFRHERYILRGLAVWDVVKARYLLTKIPHAQGIAMVSEYMDVLHLPKTSSPTGQISASLYYIDENRVLDEKIDLSQPIILMHVIEGPLSGVTMLDGLQRIVKAYRTGVATLFAYKLTHEEELMCRI